MTHHALPLLPQMASTGLFFLLCCVVLPLCITIFAVTIWASIATDQDSKLACDTPIRTYVYGFISLLVWFSWFQNPFVKHVLGYDASVDGAERPFRVQLYHVLWQLLNVGWNIAGLVWVITAKTCPETAPHMYQAAKVLVFLQLTVYCFVAVAILSLLWMVWAIRHGHLNIDVTKSNAAPEDFIESLEVMPFEASIFDDDRYPKECSICYDAFADETGERVIVKTPVGVGGPCGHVFHKVCLGNWLKQQRSCPICREDLVKANATDEHV